MIYQTKPANFKPKFEVVSCFLEYQGRFVLLHRREYKSEGGKWGVPAGKIEGRERPSAAITRELLEETGINVPAAQIAHFGKVYVRYPEYDFIYHIYSVRLNGEKKVILNQKEHQAFQWVEPQKALALNLVRDLDACIKLFYQI